MCLADLLAAHQIRYYTQREALLHILFASEIAEEINLTVSASAYSARLSRLI